MGHSFQVTVRHPEYTLRQPQWKRMRDLLAGQDAIKAAGPLYLPPLNEDDVCRFVDQTRCTVESYSGDYRTYLDNAEFYNATSLTHESFMGMIFRKPLEINQEGSDTESSEFTEDPRLRNVDYEGTSAQVFSEEITDEVGAVGRVGILYDWPMAEDLGELTQFEAESAGIRPYLKRYVAESITNWKFRNVNGVKVPISITLREEVEKDPDDPFSHEFVTQYRVLLIENGRYIQRVYNDQNAEIENLANTNITIFGQPINFLPFVCINKDHIGLETSVPPLLDLGNTNLAHYRASASVGANIFMFGRMTPVFTIPENKAEEFARTPTFFGTGKKIVLPISENGTPTAEILQASSDFTPVTNEIQKLEERMAAQGARMLSPQKRGVEAADTVRLDMIGELSIIAKIANNVSVGLTMAFSWLMGDSSEPTFVRLNTDFLTSPIDAGTITSLLKALQEKRISQEQFMDSMIRGEAVTPEADIITDTDYTEPEPSEEEKASLEAIKNPPEPTATEAGSQPA